MKDLCAALLSIPIPTFIRSQVAGSCLTFLLGLALIGCSPRQPEPPTEPEIEEEYYTLPGIQHGLIQSPVNILTSEAESVSRQRFEVHEKHPTKAETIRNEGHSIRLDFPPGTEISYDGKDFDFLQAHFHTPSEHQVDGVTFPMEMHFVNMRELEDGHHEYLVVGVLFKMGEENRFIGNFIDLIPTEAEHESDISAEPVFVDELLQDPGPDVHYYHYVGSLTTPPYTESVNWFVLQKVYEASPEQITYINKLEGNNARHVQALYSRHVELN